MRAYSELYVHDVQQRMGVMFDAAICSLGLGLNEFHDAFLRSAYARALSSGSPVLVVARSGIELAEEVTGLSMEEASSHVCATPHAEYWTGWALAFFQWASGRSFADVEARVPIEDVCAMYTPYHEMDITRFCDEMDRRCMEAEIGSSLKKARLAAGLSQSQLAALSGIPVRTLQQYEQRQKDIDHARADYVLSLARTLHCKPEELLEPKASDSYAYAFVKV